MGYSRRSALTLATGLVAGASLAACGGGGGDAGGDISKDAVKLRFTWWGSDARHQRTQQAIDLFTKKHPNITVSGEFKEWNGYWDSLATTVAANDAPDIIQMDELYLASYAERGALLDLGEASKHLKTDGIDAAALDTGKVDGKQFAVPTGLAALSIVANVSLLEQYKIAIPDDAKWTWDDLKRIGQEVSKASGGKVTGVQSWGFDTGTVNIWARQAGGSLYQADKVSIEPAVLTAYWQYLLDLAKDGTAPSPSVTVERASAPLDQSGTATNTSVFGVWWNTQLTSLAAASGQKLELLKLPSNGQPAAAQSPYYKPSMFWSVSSRSEHPAEAALFVDFLLNTPEAGDVLLTDRGVPSNGTVRTAITPKLADADKTAADFLAELQVGTAPQVTPNGASSIEAILKRHTEEVLFERQTPQQAADAFIKELQTEIDAA
ncbi:ABC transporter substrate-binding protein [Actinoplanes sp. G11-F43]|uniref:ABC transporter substrate-binding protein n=1 Tax=Actinoplanes sp. G11-F43 TaxID=3424130 RepID=UPI003D326869